MMRTRRTCCVGDHTGMAAMALAVCVMHLGGGALAPERCCADDDVPVRGGLELWLDATRINTLRESSGQGTLESGDAIDVWEDASGRGRHLVQSNENSRPKLMAVGSAWFVRFDGQDDHLRQVSAPVEFASATVFIIAAPHANPGDFRGLFAVNAQGHNDYESGLTIDLGPGATRSFEQLNVEGRGFGGAQNLRRGSEPFGALHFIEAIIDAPSKQVRLLVDGKLEGSRPLDPASFSFEQLTVGARFVTNGPGEKIVRGPAATDIAEILVYNRTLSSDESESVRGYLNAKYAKLAEELPQHLPSVDRPGVPLVRAENPPPIQMLVPGFSVREIPVSLPNVNNVRFRDDGKLVTLGYNGDVHLLSDTDGDGLEDRAETFWRNAGSLRGPIGVVLTPPNYAKGRGLFVPSKGKVSLIVDTDSDDRADKEIVVATGWDEIPQNVDAVGIAMDAEQNLYFGLGTANYANAYLIDERGQAAYDIHSDRGTVQKVSADFSRRETVCTGVRFPIAFAFNRRGDLFCTEQEGATWLANGNPFDELLHIRPGRHYGFPPRHPRHNPGVVDEPSTFDYSPQHQSTCGMVFNEGVNGGPAFGPPWWAGQAIVCGESRGKIWRTQLVESPAGYVASSQLLACLQMLTVDACVAPNGDLVVACHSGPPDWGTGPTGIGKLFRISMTSGAAPRPVSVWAASNREVRIAFDHALDPLTLRNLADQIRIEYGDHVRAGDRFEHLVPPYAAVQRQSMTPRFALPVVGAAVTGDLRTLIISTAPMTIATSYAVTLPDLVSPSADGAARPEHAQMDVDFSLHGVHAEWQSDKSPPTASWSGWLPHLDLAVARALVGNSAEHQPLWEALKRESGTLTLTTQIDLSNILRPEVQPGSAIDYEWPTEEARLTLTASREFRMSSSRQVLADRDSSGTTFQASLTAPADTTAPIAVTITIATDGEHGLDLSCSVSTNEDASPRPLPLHRFLLPWVVADQRKNASELAPPLEIAELKGGSWGLGRRVFRSEAAGCFKCHSLHGDAARIGPDLRNLVHRDYASVLRDIVTPSYAINPDYISHVVSLRDGRVLTGVLRTEAGELLLGDDKGVTLRLSPDDVEQMQPASLSVMPTGVHEKLSATQLRDLMTYLLTPPPQMPLDSPLAAPPVRTPAEVAAALAGAPETDVAPRPLNIVLVDGPKDHGPGEHDYPAWQRVWEQLLTADATLTVSTAHEFPNDEQLAVADVVIFFQKGSFDGPRPDKLDAFLKRGGGAVYIHWAVNGDERATEFSRRIGLASRGGNIKFRHGPLTLDIHNTDHPIVRNFDQLQLYDESYWLLSGDRGDSTLLATSTEDGLPTPQLWVRDHKPGRVFVSIPGHYSWTFDDPLLRILLLRGIAWTAKEPVDRFNELVPLGARMSW